MPGERTPDQSSRSSHGTSDDDISLREHIQRQLDTQLAYFEQRLHDMRDLLDERFAAQSNAVGELKTATSQRFESVNEFRSQLNDQAQQFMGRAESISRHDRSTEMITAMGNRHDTEIRLLRERFEADVKALRDRHETDMGVVNSRLDLGQGRSSGLDKAWGYIVGVIGAAAAIVTLIIATR